ncbi:hypothetical protein NDU88_001186 [Pleurodeles waltl]|uniref:Secreted protein n=1 Tax=Pleurodeles waltl TaxID=8319 RepID=A0AAV7LXZ0_PLEWA|nr:hypothetical protein NDU88_001186 [Pleurodeles waltl]
MPSLEAVVLIAGVEVPLLAMVLVVDDGGAVIVVLGELMVLAVVEVFRVDKGFVVLVVVVGDRDAASRNMASWSPATKLALTISETSPKPVSLLKYPVCGLALEKK